MEQPTTVSAGNDNPQGGDLSTIKRFENVDSMTINGGIGDGRNDGGPAYFIESIVDKDADSMEND
jgi:hypothetical protein